MPISRNAKILADLLKWIQRIEVVDVTSNYCDLLHVWKRVWILAARSENGCRKWFFDLKWSQNLENRAAHPNQEFPGVPLPRNHLPLRFTNLVPKVPLSTLGTRLYGFHVTRLISKQLSHIMHHRWIFSWHAVSQLSRSVTWKQYIWFYPNVAVLIGVWHVRSAEFICLFDGYEMIKAHSTFPPLRCLSTI